MPDELGIAGLATICALVVIEPMTIQSSMQEATLPMRLRTTRAGHQYGFQMMQD